MKTNYRKTAREVGLGLAIGLGALTGASAGVVQAQNWGLSWNGMDTATGGIGRMFSLDTDEHGFEAFDVQVAGLSAAGEAGPDWIGHWVAGPLMAWISSKAGSPYQFDAIDLDGILDWEDGSYTFYTSIGKGQPYQPPTFAARGLTPMAGGNYGAGVNFWGVGLVLTGPEINGQIPEPAAAWLTGMALLAGLWASRKRGQTQAP